MGGRNKKKEYFKLLICDLGFGFDGFVMKDINHYGQLSSRFVLQLNLVLIFINILSKPKTGSKKLGKWFEWKKKEVM
jgi:uncharacterized membrane protein